MSTSPRNETHSGLEWERLKLERLQAIFKFLGVIGATIAFAWSAWVYFDTRNREAETRRIEASKTFLDLQLRLFDEITGLTSRLAVTPPDERAADDVKRFWELYWGQLGMIERGGVERAMHEYGKLLDSETEFERPFVSSLGAASIKIAHAAREELAQSWKVDEWRSR